MAIILYRLIKCGKQGLDIFALDKASNISHLIIPEKTQKDKSVA